MREQSDERAAMIRRSCSGMLSLLALSSLGCGSAPPPPSPPPAPPRPATVEAPAEREPSPAPEPAASHVKLIEPPPPGESAVHFSLTASAASAAPGGTFWLAARLDLAPGYRVFWVNPGAEGRPTRIEFHVPEGFEVTEPRFPAPEKFDLGDAGVAYGYREDTAAFAEVRVKTKLDRGATYRFDVEASWLACETRCFPESAAAYVEIAASDSVAPDEFPRELARLRDALPTPLTELPGVSYRWRRGGRLQLTAAATEWLEFLPEHPQDPKLVDVDTKSKPGMLKLRFESGTPGSRVQGLAVSGSSQNPRYVRVDVPWPEQPRH